MQVAVNKQQLTRLQLDHGLLLFYRVSSSPFQRLKHQLRREPQRASLRVKWKAL